MAKEMRLQDGDGCRLFLSFQMSWPCAMQDIYFHYTGTYLTNNFINENKNKNIFGNIFVFHVRGFILR